MAPRKTAGNPSRTNRGLWLLDAAYAAGLVLGMPYLAARFVLDPRYRDAIGERLGSGNIPCDGDPRVWFHGASAGEVLAARCLYGLMRDERPGLGAVFSSVTYTGRRAAERAYPQCTARYLPIDISCFVRRALARMRPHLLVLLEGDIWPNFVCAARDAGARIAVVNGTFSEKSVRRYRRLSRFFGPAFDAVDLFCLRDDAQISSLSTLGIPPEKIAVTGNLKFDNLLTEPDETRDRLMRMLGVDTMEKVVIGGSTHEGEEEPLLDLLAERADFRLVIAPRYPHRAGRIEALVRARNLPCVRYSAIVSGGTRTSSADVVIVDTVGDLAGLYQIATVAFVGGSLIPRGGQNFMEPAALGLPLVVGPHTFNFKEDMAVLRAAEAVVEAHDGSDLKSALGSLLDDRQKREALGSRARGCILDKRGAGRLTFRMLKGLMG